MKKDFLELGVKVVFGIRVTNKLVDATRWEAEEETFKTDGRRRFVYGGAGEAMLVELNVAGRRAENSFSDLLAGFYGSLDLLCKQAKPLQCFQAMAIQWFLPSAQGL